MSRIQETFGKITNLERGADTLRGVVKVARAHGGAIQLGAAQVAAHEVTAIHASTGQVGPFEAGRTGRLKERGSDFSARIPQLFCHMILGWQCTPAALQGAVCQVAALE